jgi:hypothetical protein
MRCGSCVRAGKMAEAEIFFPYLRKVWDGFLTRRDRVQRGENRQVGEVFHFYDAPTVTAGLIGFVFDIREVIKVARYTGDVIYAGGSGRCGGDGGGNDGDHGQ